VARAGARLAVFDRYGFQRSTTEECSEAFFAAVAGAFHPSERQFYSAAGAEIVDENLARFELA
jgi:hypothetical protein